MADSAAADVSVLLSRAKPPAAAGLRRARLLDPLSGSAAARLSLITAPAGTGKTTILGQLADKLIAPAWLTLDEDLQSLPMLLAHLQQSFATVLGRKASPWRSAGEMINTLDAALPAGEPTVLILDEMHTLAGSPALDTVRMLLAHQPTQLRLILAGRQMPDLGLARYGLSTRVHQIGAPDLRLRPFEMSELISSRSTWRHWEPLTAELDLRTGGWAAAIQIYLSVGEPGRPLAATETAAKRLINRYLEEQVLDQLTPDMQDFLLRSSVLEEFSAERCAQLPGLAATHRRLVELERAALIGSVVPDSSTSTRAVYRHHQVLRVHLLAELEARQGSQPNQPQRLMAVGPDCAFVPEQRSTEPDQVSRKQLKIDVLGTFAVTLDGAPLVTSTLRPLHRELLALFCAFAGRVVQRDQLTEWFWPDLEPARAIHNLQVAVSEVRRLLNAGQAPNAETRLCREGSGYRLQLVATADCDVRQFEQLLQLASTAVRRGGRERAATHLESALAIYRGDLLPEIGYPEWVLAERDRIRQIAGAAYDQLVGLRVAAGQHRQAVSSARAGLAHDRHRDGLWRQLVDSLFAIDEPAAATAAQRNYQALLADLDIPDGAPAASRWGIVA